MTGLGCRGGSHGRDAMYAERGRRAAGSPGEPGRIMFQVAGQPGPILMSGQVDISLGCLKHKEASRIGAEWGREGGWG